MNTIEDLQHRKRICGTAPTLEDLLNPIKEDVIGHTGLEFPGGDDEIIAEATWQMMDNTEEDLEDEVDDLWEPIPPKEALDLCEHMEKNVKNYLNIQESFRTVGCPTQPQQPPVHMPSAHQRMLTWLEHVRRTLESARRVERGPRQEARDRGLNHQADRYQVRINFAWICLKYMLILLPGVTIHPFYKSTHMFY
ncbi:uncharacterized protein F5891DRAFT_984280 [Suillus fuscotomentosus]|uniref:Uncharacterized protein n=1 Tax=Suillus fuscotomentosus TaxID=1912939 RepID=A0AAD4DXF2_9AGAM|nr:uncharacterized protein F5891DRAFT_984280 [Suillus fuscotomentosus]KAG1895336.1 hypothetical protein F5891DRAFT_984280 [Suillus fuscotomentosus]